MKNIASLLIVAGFTALTSCSNLLETNPADFYTETSFWQTSSHAEEAVTAAYQALTHTDLYGEQTPFMFEVMTSNAYHKDNYQSAHDFATGTHNSTTQGMNLVTWRG